MDNPKTDQYYIRKIIRDLEFVVAHMQGVELLELTQDEVLLDSMLFRMIQISESARRLTDEYRSSRQSIPWAALFGLRNRIVHDYGNVDMAIVYNTLVSDMPQLLQAFCEN